VVDSTNLLGESVEKNLEEEDATMRTRKALLFLLVAAFLLALGAYASNAQAAPPPQAASVSLTVLNPQGAVPVVNKLAPRLSTLDGKKVALYLMLPSTYEFQLAGVPFYNKMAEMLKKQFPTIELVMPDKLDNAPEVKAADAITETKANAAILGIGG